MVASLVALAIAGGLLWRDYERTLDRPTRLAKPALFEIEPGASVAAIAHHLRARGWLSRPLYFRLEAIRRGVAGRIQAGVYEVRAGDSPRDLLGKFVRGDVKTYTLTIVEGSTVRDLRALLRAAPGLSSTLADTADGALMERLAAPGSTPEGRFFPATYFYRHGDSDLTLLRRAHAKMSEVLARLWAGRDADVPYETPDEALIMASLIEKETAQPDERPAIAGVFVRRLRLGMKLQSDPTVVYGLGDAFDGNLTRAQLQEDTPFNTYTRTGLPPAPIALPGEAALRAALHPAPGDALYFVARGDGSHEFSRTLEAHNDAVRRLQPGQPR